MKQCTRAHPGALGCPFLLRCAAPKYSGVIGFIRAWLRLTLMFQRSIFSPFWEIISPLHFSRIHFFCLKPGFPGSCCWPQQQPLYGHQHPCWISPPIQGFQLWVPLYGHPWHAFVLDWVILLPKSPLESTSVLATQSSPPTAISLSSSMLADIWMEC